MYLANEKVLYIPGQTNFVTFLLPEGICSITGNTVEQMQAEYPGAVEMSYVEASALVDAAISFIYLTGPKEITEARFLEMFHVLPPARWVNLLETESFLLSELLIGGIGTFFARIGNRFFEINAPAKTKHAEIISMILDAFAPATRKIEEVWNESVHYDGQ